MNRTEQNLVDAIESGNYEKAMKSLSKFIDLKSTTDEKSNSYFDKVEALQEVVLDNDVSEKAEPIKEEVVEEEVVVAPRVETRGAKPKSKSRKEVEKAFYNALEVAQNYREENKRTSEARFSLRLVKQLILIKKRSFR